MTDNNHPPTGERFTLNEDWLATIIGLGVVLVLALGGIAAIPYPLFNLF